MRSCTAPGSLDTHLEVRWTPSTPDNVATFCVTFPSRGHTNHSPVFKPVALAVVHTHSRASGRAVRGAPESDPKLVLETPEVW